MVVDWVVLFLLNRLCVLSTLWPFEGTKYSFSSISTGQMWKGFLLGSKVAPHWYTSKEACVENTFPPYIKSPVRTPVIPAGWLLFPEEVGFCHWGEYVLREKTNLAWGFYILSNLFPQGPRLGKERQLGEATWDQKPHQQLTKEVGVAW